MRNCLQSADRRTIRAGLARAVAATRTLLLFSLLCAPLACGIQEHDAPARSLFRLPPSAPGSNAIDIAGTLVPRERAIAIIHIGHSNMMGFGVSPASLSPHFFDPAPRLWSYQGAGRFVPAAEPTATRRAGWRSAGPGMALLRAAAARAPADHHFISIGLGVSAATSQDFAPGGLYRDAIVDLAAELSGRVTFAGVAIMLGSTDRHLPRIEQARYAERIAQIAADLRATLASPELPMLHTDYELEATGTYSPHGPIGAQFRPLIHTLPARVARLALVPTDGLGMQDDHHFDMAGHKLWAERAVDRLISSGWASWATFAPPSAP